MFLLPRSVVPTTTLHKAIALCSVVVAMFTAPQEAQAFCGFYVSGADASLYNDATQVALMRLGTKTVLSMQNNYQGPAQDFAMVIPVPVVLQEANVKTLEPTLFSKIDQLTAPRLVEYWEKDPCQPTYDKGFADAGSGGFADAAAPPVDYDSDTGEVQVEAEFAVGEYEIVVLSSTHSTALDTWLREQNYAIPQGASPYFQPYIQNGMYFFVARVDLTKVTYRDGQAVLSPLRFHYDSPEFSLPIRLGLINSQGEQDLLVYLLGIEQRYEVANYPNITIPTNIRVKEAAKDNFPGFYTRLFEQTVGQKPGAVVTEYSWDASTCDPCPGPTLDTVDFATLGADVLREQAEQPDVGLRNNWVITRLHARYDSENLGEDLVFREASPILGGREVAGVEGALEKGAQPGSVNNFQGRYIIRHGWEGEVNCENPVFGQWGGPQNHSQPMMASALSPNTTGEPAFGEGSSGGDASVPLEDLIDEDIPEIEIEAADPGTTPSPFVPDEQQVEEPGASPRGSDGSSSGCSTASNQRTRASIGLNILALLGLVLLGFLARRRLL